MGKSSFSDDLKPDTVHQVTERGCPVSAVSERLGARTPQPDTFWQKIQRHLMAREPGCA